MIKNLIRTILVCIGLNLNYKDHFDFLDKQHQVLYGDDSYQLYNNNDQAEATNYNKMITRLKTRCK